MKEVSLCDSFCESEDFPCSGALRHNGVLEEYASTNLTLLSTCVCSVVTVCEREQLRAFCNSK